MLKRIVVLAGLAVLVAGCNSNPPYRGDSYSYVDHAQISPSQRAHEKAITEDTVHSPVFSSRRVQRDDSPSIFNGWNSGLQVYPSGGWSHGGWGHGFGWGGSIGPGWGPGYWGGPWGPGWGW